MAPEPARGDTLAMPHARRPVPPRTQVPPALPQGLPERGAGAAWDPRLETGIDVIDAQHRTLFEAVHALVDSYRMGQASRQARESLLFLAEYSRVHFQTEARFRRSMGYPDLASHRIEHRRLVARLHTLQEKQDKGYLVTAEVALFLADWLRHHIQGADMDYVRFLRSGQRH